MDKKEYINSLKNIKIVLGNGFDLHCGLHTKYSDYYCKNFNKYLFIKDSLENYKNTDIFDFDFNTDKVKSINTWDVFFALNGPTDPRLWKRDWCDIEKLIFSSLVSYNPNTSDPDKIAIALVSRINWNNINSLIFADRLGLNYDDRFVVEFIKNRCKLLNLETNDFYGFLLKELKAFEKDFGEFVYKQFHNSYFETCNYGTKAFLNTGYLNDALFTIDELCYENNLSSIDSFNYSNIEKPSLREKFQNINGSYANPIFGVDSKFSPDDVRYIFTKTARRIDSDMFNDTFESKPYFENVVIYGHSLNEADYSYFFPLFDKLNLLDSTATGILVFAYSVYDDACKEKIEASFRKSMSTIIFEYAKSKKVSDPERLLDSLSTQKRILTYMLNNIHYGPRQTELDREWDKIYKEMDAIIDFREKESKAK